MIEKIRHLFQSKEHKEIMLGCLLLLFVIIYAILACCALYLGLEHIFWVKFGAGMLVLFLFLGYLKSRNTMLIVTLFILLMELDTSFAMLSKDFYDFVAIYPFLIIFGFFFFFRLKTALWMTLAHFIYWIIMTILRYDIVADHPMFQALMPDINMFTTSVVVVFLGIFYQFSTEIPYGKLTIDDRQKTTLLKEIHHRIKNNLNTMASIMGLQIMNYEKGYVKDPKEILLSSKLRIDTIAMIHESLYNNKDIEYVDFQSYTRNLTDLIIQTYNEKIDVKIDSEIKFCHEEMMLHLGIIINELFTNSIKYAFPKSSKQGKVYIAMYEKKNEYIFIYHNRENREADIQKILESKTLGIKLIRLTVKQMHGVLDVKKEDGLVFTIKFPKA